VLVGPGENAGIIDIGQGYAIAFKIESHNHPSFFIEPFQGAAPASAAFCAIFWSMGAARCGTGCHRFGPLDDPQHGDRNRRILEGVVEGISALRQALGVTNRRANAFLSLLQRNPLVNVFALGFQSTTKFSSARHTGIRQSGHICMRQDRPRRIHGASMASAEFTEESSRSAPTRGRSIHGKAPAGSLH
jgi:phosphoribosylformylglycinamidine synthase